jgi:hypothetical protein
VQYGIAIFNTAYEVPNSWFYFYFILKFESPFCIYEVLCQFLRVTVRLLTTLLCMNIILFEYINNSITCQLYFKERIQDFIVSKYIQY